MSQELFDRILDGQTLTKIEERALKNFIATDEGNDLLEGMWINAAEDGDIDVLEILLNLEVDINLITIKGLTALTTAAENDQVDCIEFLLQHRANIDQADEWGNTALMLASSNDRKDSIQILLENNADLHLTDSCGDTALDLAKTNGNEEIIQLLSVYYLLQGDDYSRSISPTEPEESQPPAKRVKIEEDVAQIVGDTDDYSSDLE